MLNAEERIREIELRLFKEVCATPSKSEFKLLGTARALAELDVLSTLREVAALRGYIRPEVHEGSEPEIREGRHPVVEQLLKGERYVPNDLVFEKGEIVSGGADRSYGIHAAQLAGLPASVIQRANEIMAELEKSSGRAMRRNPHASYQASLFPKTNPLLDELKEVNVNSLPHRGAERTFRVTEKVYPQPKPQNK